MRSRVRVAAVVLLAAALPACASIPTSGPVREGSDLSVQRQDVAVPFIAEPPAPGASAEDVVRGFLRANADFRGDHAVARLYLAPRARQQWRPGAGTTVYDRVTAPLTVEESDGGQVTVRATEVATIDGEGGYRRTAGGTEAARTFGMERVDGEWRIAALEDGLQLSRFDVQESFRQVSLYFLSPSRNTLVPDVVLVPELPGLSTKLVSRLLRGPTASLRGAVDTAFPQGTSLEVQSVPVRDGLATVQLDQRALRADEDAREQMSAQIVWTLKQLGPEIARIHITAGGEELGVPGVSEEQDRDSWQTFDPDALPGSPSVYVVRGLQVGRLIEGRFEPVEGPAGAGQVALRGPAVSLDTARLAAVSADGTRLYVGRFDADAPLEEVLRGGDLSQPSWDPVGNLWLVDRGSGQLLLLPGGAGPAVRVQLPRLPGGPSQIAVSRDGARAALVTGAGRSARLVVGALTGVERVEPGSPNDTVTVAVTAVHEVLPTLRSVRDVAWADARTLAVLGSQDGLPVAPLYTSIDGYDVVAVEPPSDPVSLAAVPPLEAQSSPLVVATAAGRLVQYIPSRGWVELGEGSDPAYPG